MLLCVALCCSVLQSRSKHLNLQSEPLTRTFAQTDIHSLQHTATHRNTLQHTVPLTCVFAQTQTVSLLHIREEPFVNAMQHIATQCNILHQHTLYLSHAYTQKTNFLSNTATHCKFHHTATHCNNTHAVCCSVLQCVAVCCSVILS